MCLFKEKPEKKYYCSLCGEEAFVIVGLNYFRCVHCKLAGRQYMTTQPQQSSPQRKVSALIQLGYIIMHPFGRKSE